MELTITDVHATCRSYPRWINANPRPFLSPTHREYNAKPRMHFFIEGENLLENLGNRFSRPKDLYKRFIPQILEQLGLPPDTKTVWSQKAGW
jgi:hypothetical protein